MYNLIYSTYKNKSSLLEGFSDVELELFEYIINSTPEVMLAYKDKDNKLKLNHGYIILLVLLTKTLGPSRELILNTAHAKDLQRLYELADTNSDNLEHLKDPSFKLLQLLAGDIWPDISELFTSEDEARSALYDKINLVEAMVPIIRKRGSLDSLMTILNSYIPYNGLAAVENEPMTAVMQLNNENDLYGNRQLYKLLLHAKPAGYKIEVLTREYPFYETASPALITDSTNPVMPWISGMSNGIYPYFGSPLQTPDITDVRVAGGILGPATLAVTFKNKHFEPLKATISAEGTYQIGSKTYNADLTPVVYTISDREPSLTPQNVYRTINNSFPIDITITEVTVTIEPHNSGIPGDSRSASATFYTSSPGIILAPVSSPVVQPTITDIELDKNLFTASISITNNDPAALSGTLAVNGSNNYKVAFTDLLPDETRILTITHPDLYLREELLLEATRNNGVGPALTHPINVAPYVPADLSILPRLKTPTPVISTELRPYIGGDKLAIIAKNTDPGLPVRCYGAIFGRLEGYWFPIDEYDVEIQAGGTSILYEVPQFHLDPSAIVTFGLTAECTVYAGIPTKPIKEPVTRSYTTGFVSTPALPTAPQEQENAYLTFQSNSSFTLEVANSTKNWNGTLYYSTDLETWSVWDGTTTLRSSDDNKLYLSGARNTRITGNNQNYRWVLEGSNIECTGNIENLLDWETVASGNHPPMASSCYAHLFRDCAALVSAPALPATTLASACYLSMFEGCTALTSPPALPATTLAEYCYSSMFKGCTALASPPALPATTLVSYCYISMFRDCTALVSAPVLPATILADSCYYYMFSGCTSLTSPPALPATTLAIGCYQYMFSGCKALTSVPALPATTLADYCYYEMFKGCTALKISPTQTGAYLYEWRIPTSGIGVTATDWNSNMLSGTGGTFTGDPSTNKTYYVEHPPVPEPSTTYLTFRSNSPFSLEVANSTKNWDGTLYYSTDLETWSEWDGTTPLSSSVDNKLYLRGKGNTVITGNDQNYRWVLDRFKY